METTKAIQKVNELVSVLTDDQKQLLKDTINMGFWGGVRIWSSVRRMMR